MCTVLLCLTMSCNKTVSNENKYIHSDNSDYITKKDVKCRWKDNLRDDYTSAFNIENIQRVNSILTETLNNKIVLNTKKLNKAPHFEEFVPLLLNTSTNENIKQSFSMEEVTFGIKQLKVNKAGGSDIILNDFF